MKTAFTNLGFVFLLWFGCGVSPSLNCPPKCGCERKSNGFSVNCANKGFKSTINPNDLPANTFELDLSNNEIQTIANNAFKGKNLTRIRKLILSGNGLQMIAADAFSGLNKLTRIDLSHNKLSVLNGDVFRKLGNIRFIDISSNQLIMLNKTQFYGCKNLKTIDLSSNKLSLLPEGLFSFQYRNLKKIDLELNPLICDCNLRWMIKSMAARDVSVQGRCELPFKMKENKLTDLNKKEMVCDKLDLPVMSFGPQGDQIAFKGDSHMFVCNSSWVPGMQITWYKDNILITTDPNDKRVEILFNFDPGQLVISSVLDIKQLTVEDSGYYRCNVTHKGGYLHLSTFHLAIIPSDAKYCKAASTDTDRGTFHWHHTAAGGFAFLPCPVGVISSLLDHQGTEIKARRNCSMEGEWKAVEAQPCAYANEITRALHDLKLKTVNNTTATVISSQLLNISKRAREFSEPLDVIYAAVVIKQLTQAGGRNKILIKNLVNTISNIMETDAALLQEAQRSSKACTSMVIDIGLIVTRFPLDVLQDVKFISNNIVVYVAPISKSDLAGKMCYVTTADKGSRLKNINCLACVYNNSCEEQTLVETAIYLPPSLFLKMPLDETVKFKYIVYSNSKLFPDITYGSESERTRQVSSSVMSAQFDVPQLTNLSHPVVFKFKNQQNGEEPIPVYWDHSGNGKLGSWKQNTDCGRISSQGNYTITKCSQLSNKTFFAVMTNVRKPVDTGASGNDSWYSFPFSLELIVFIGAGIAVVLILATLIVYALIRELRFGRDDAAMIMNHCLALIVAIVLFVTGVNHVTNVLVCRAVGVLLHYFMLCSLLWIGCGAICLHRLIRTAIQPEEFNPVLRYYMISWGIPLIICGITIAGNPDNYNVDDYCWLRRHPFFGAFVGPACLIVLVDLVLFLRVFNLIKRTYGTEETLQASQENETEIETEDNALVIQQAPLTNTDDDDTGDTVDKSALPNKQEMMDHIGGSCVILLCIILSMALGVLMIRYQDPRALYIALNCLFAVTLVVLGVLVFIFYCYRKEKVRLFWRKCCCRCWCLTNKQYEIQPESPTVQTCEEQTPSPKTPAEESNTKEMKFTGEEIHGAKNPLSQGDEDSQSNVSLPYSAVIRIDKQEHLVEKEAEVLTDKAPSVSDKQSCTSAPLPVGYKPRGRLLKHPPGHRHSYTENTQFPPSITEDRRAPLAPPEGTASSVDSSVQLPTDTAPSECHSSVRDAVDPVTVSRNTNTSCSASEVSIPLDIPPMKRRPPIPGSSSHGSDVAPPLPLKVRIPVASTAPRPAADTQDLLTHYSIPDATANSIPREIPRDHVVVRERYHIPYEPRAVSEKPRDHYQIVPLPPGRRDQYLVQPGHDGGPIAHNQYQVSPDNYQIPEGQNPGQRTYDQLPSPTQPQNLYHITRDQSTAQRMHDLYQMARDMPPPLRTYENYPLPQEPISPQGVRERHQDHDQRLHDQVQRPPEHSQMPRDPRSHDHLLAPRDHMSRDQQTSERPADYIAVSDDQTSAQKAHDRSTTPCNENERDTLQAARDPNVINDTNRSPAHEAAERPHDQYAGEGPQKPQQPLPPGDKTADKRPDVPPDKNGVRPQNAPRGSREQSNGIVHVPRRRSRNPYQIARDIHHNLGIETRPSRRSNRVPVEQRSQPQKLFSKDVTSPGETPKERTPRSSMSSWKDDRPKTQQKEWVSDMPKNAVFVPVPHLKRPTPEPSRNETSV